MATFTFRDRPIYYETHGTEGEVILLLNGIMMSTASWAPFVRNFSAANRLILLDFLDQGQSGRLEGSYGHEVQIEVIAALLEHLHLAKVNICGISYGAEVGLGYAVQHPDKVRRLLLFNGGARTAPLLRDIGRGWNEAAKSEGGLNYYLATIPVIYSDSFYEKNETWMAARQKLLVPFFASQEVKDRLVRLTNSSESFDVVKDLGKLDMPVLVVTAANDFLIPLREQHILLAGIKHAHHVVLPISGHASMYEQPMLFSALTLGFVNSAESDFAI
jgi:pimeloyl-ACP methyl ester carboxylesterase